MTSSRKNTAATSDHNLTVCLRIRPMNEDELNIGTPMITHVMDNNVVVLLDPLEDPDDILRANRSRERQFVFDHVFRSNCSQEEVFNFSTLPLISQVLDGYTATVFAYGPTGAGKTYTMLGVDDQPGIMFKALENLFKQMGQLDDDFTFQVCLSYLEVYNEMIRDLLSPSATVLDLREDQNGVQVAGITEKNVGTTSEVLDLLKQGNAARSVEATGANKHSSRSHCVLQVTLVSRPRLRNVQEQLSKGKLFLIDLAGSERASNTLNRGKRMTEGAHINRSLLALGNCINALSDPNGKRYINYRDSKLTRLLKDALGGNCKTVMIAHVSPAAQYFEDSRNTLVYADRAKHIRTKIHRNMYDVNFHLVQYNSIIAELKQEITRLRNKLETFNSPTEVEEQTSVVAMSDQVQEMKMKEQFLIALQRHLDCKKSLSENMTTDLDLSLEESRCQVIIKEWEFRKAERISTREIKSDDKNIGDEEKQMEIAGLDFMSEPENVIITKNELRITQNERQKLQTHRQKLERSLEKHSQKVKQLESTIDDKIKSPSAKEYLSLLCRLHKLEIQYSDMRTENVILRQQGVFHDLRLTTLLRHSGVCNQIIMAQSTLIMDQGLNVPKELEMLMELYMKDESTSNFSRSLFDSTKFQDYNFSRGRDAAIEPDSTSDIRDLTSEMSIIDNNPEEIESTAGALVNSNTHRSPEDTWYKDTINMDDMKKTHNNFDVANTDVATRRVFDPVLKGRAISKPQNNPSSQKLHNAIILPELRGRPLYRPSEFKHDNNRSQSFGPDGKKARYTKDVLSDLPLSYRPGNPNSRRLMMGPRLDGAQNYDQNGGAALRRNHNKYSIYKNPLLYGYNDVNSNPYSKDHKKTSFIDNKINNPRAVRANEIRKLNERKARHGFQNSPNEYNL